MPQKTISIVIEVDGADDAIRQARQMRSALDDLGRGGAESMIQLRQQSREVTQAMKEMKRTFHLRQLQKEMVGDLEDFFGRIISGARTTGDLFKNIWRGIADFFKRTVLEMAAAWAIAGGSLADNFPAGGFPLGGIFRLPGIGPGKLPAATLLPTAVSARRAPTFAETLGLPATTPTGDVLARLGLGGGLRSAAPTLGALAGIGLIGSGNRLVSTLGGFFGGGLAGLATGFAFGGPIGAIAGGLIGLFAGGSGDKKRHDTAIANQGSAQLLQIKEDFERFRRDFASAIDAANQVWNQMAAAWVRPESARSQRPYFDAYLRQLRDVEDERNRRRQLLALAAIPEFASGGAVADSFTRGGSRGLLAMLHPGEFVMNRQAVDRIGTSVLEGLNRGFEPRPSAGSGQTVTLEIPSQEFFNEVVERSIPVILRRGGAASRVLRG